MDPHRAGRLLRRPSLTGAVAAAVFAFLPPAAWGATSTFSNTNLVTIPTSGSATPSPVEIPVTGLRGPLGVTEVTLAGFGHTNPDDVDVLGVAPSGRTGLVMSDACGPDDREDVTWTFTPFAFSALSDNDGSSCTPGLKTNGVFRGDGGTGADTSDNFPGAPAGPYNQSPSALGSGNPNGTWRFYVVDDSAGEGGDLEQGISITLDYGTSVAALPAAGASPTVGRASPYPFTRTVGGQPPDTVVTDVDVVFNGVYHTFPADLDLLLVGPGGQSTILMSDACGSADAENAQWRWDDEAPAGMPAGGCPNGSYQPTDVDAVAATVDEWATAPAGPHGSALSVFDHTDPTGTWRLFTVDDASGDEGFLTNQFQLELTTRVKAEVSFASPITVTEGGTGEVTLLRSADPPLGPATVRVRSAPGTALSTEFPPIDVTVDFAAGEAAKTFSVGSVDDGQTEQNEDYTLALSSPAGDAILASATSTSVTIADNDGPGGGADVTPPETTIDKGPAKKSDKRKAKFRFSANEAATFECARDQSEFAPCKSPTKYKGLDRGRHKFLVRAVDAARNTDPTPAKMRWKIR